MAQSENPRDNIILIVCDCLRSDHAYNKEVMPFINHLAENKREAYTNAPDTYMAMPTLMTGLMPFEKTALSGINSSNRESYLPKILTKNGYTTYGITANTVTSSYFGYNKYFDFFIDFWDRKEKTTHELPTWLHNVHNKIPLFLKENLLFKKAKALANRLTGSQNFNISSKITAQEIVSEVKKIKFKPNGNFLFLHFMDTHLPYVPRKNKIKKSRLLKLITKIYSLPHELKKFEIAILKQLYMEEAQYLDQEIRNLITYLKNSFNWKNTKLILTADHGESFGETDYFLHPRSRVNNTQHHIQIPFITKGIELKTKRIWTHDIYSLLLGQPLLKRKHKDLCVGYEIYKRSSHRSQIKYKPSVLNDTKTISKNIRRLPYGNIFNEEQANQLVNALEI